MKPEDHTKADVISHLTIYPPIIYLGGLVIGLLLDAFITVQIMPEAVFLPLGVLFLFLSPVLILWARYSSYYFLRSGKICDATTKQFKGGPYKFSRNPIYLALALLVIGFGFLVNSIFIIIAAIISFLIVHFAILRREEMILEKKYGEDYLEYKKSVRCWF